MLLFEFSGFWKSVRWQAAGLGAGAKPIGQFGFRACFVAQFPGEAGGEAENPEIGQIAVLVFLQGDAGTFCHFRHLVQREDQQFPVLADDGDVIAFGGHAAGQLFSGSEVEDLLAGAAFRGKLGAGNDEAPGRAGGEEVVAGAVGDEEVEDTILVGQVDEEANGLAVAAAARQVGRLDRKSVV